MKTIKVEDLAKEYKGRVINQEEFEKLLLPQKQKTIYDLKYGDIYWTL